jgi:hypothetical protein
MMQQQQLRSQSANPGESYQNTNLIQGHNQ